jgi:hypothetical protein
MVVCYIDRQEKEVKEGALRLRKNSQIGQKNSRKLIKSAELLLKQALRENENSFL